MIDLYIHKREEGYIIQAKKRENEHKRSCHDEAVFCFLIKDKNKAIVLKKVYEGLISYSCSEVAKYKEEVDIRVLDKDLFDAFRKSRKSLGKMKNSFTTDKDYNIWKEAFDEKGKLIKILMKNKSTLNIVYDSLEDNKTLDVVKYLEAINISTLNDFPDIEEQLKINEEVKILMRECVLREIATKIEETVETQIAIDKIVIYSDAGISIKGDTESGHSYGSVILDAKDKDELKCFLKIKGRIDLLKHIQTKHNVDFMELYSAYRSLKIIKDKIKSGEISAGVSVEVRMDNKSNIDIFQGLKKNSSPLNRVLWDEIGEFSKIMKIDMKWVKGHDKDIHNNMADELVSEGRLLEKEGEVIILNTKINRAKRKI